MKKAILLIGGGSNLAKSFINSIDCGKYDIIVLSRTLQNYPSYIKQIKFNEKIIDIHQINNLKIKIAYIFSSISNIKECEDKKDKCYNFNVLWTTNLIKILNKLKIKIVFLSTDLVYSFRNGETIRFPQNYYAKTKMIVEDFIFENVENYTIFRLSKVLSNDFGILREWHDSLIRGDNLTAYSDLFIAPINTSYLNDFLENAIVTHDRKKINLCGRNPITYYEIAKKFCKLNSFNENRIISVSFKNLKGDIKYHFVDLSKFNEIEGIYYPELEDVILNRRIFKD